MQPPIGSFPEYVNSSNLHTLSHVHLGHERRIPVDQSLMKKSYRPLSKVGVKRVRAPLKDNIPFDYPGIIL